MMAMELIARLWLSAIIPLLLSKIIPFFTLCTNDKTVKKKKIVSEVYSVAVSAKREQMRTKQEAIFT